MSSHRSAAWPLSWLAMALIVYATLYPLSGWQWPERQAFSWMLPKLHREFSGDLASNLVGYLPLGAILCVAHLRSGRSVPAAALATVLTGTGLSYTLELIQYTLPGRVPSVTDWVLNTLGVAWGALAAVTMHALGLIDLWHTVRERWFIPQAGHGLALLWVWPLGLLFPPPLPLGQGQLWPHLRVLLVEWTAHTPLQRWLLPDDPLSLWAGTGALLAGSWPALLESLTVAAGLLMPMCVACAMARPRRLRLVLLSGAVLVGVGVTTLASALNFAPVHALTWLTTPTVVGLMLGALGAVALMGLSRSLCAWLGLGATLALVVMIHLAPTDPYYAATLAAWEQGRFIRFHGLSRWIGLLWPYAALVWLVARIVHREPRAHASAQAGSNA